MIQTLRRRFIIIAMCAMIAVLATIIGIINYGNFRHISDNADVLLTMIADNQGVFPKSDQLQTPPDGLSVTPPEQEGIPQHKQRQEFSPEVAFTTRYFTVALNAKGKVQSINTGMIAAVTTQEAKEMATTLHSRQKTGGFYGNYKFRATETDEGVLYVFLDCSDSLATTRSFLWISLGVSAAGILLVFLLVMIFSHIAMKPVAESFAKQKQFITDASHELKTPLTIIDANTEVLEMEQGENEWTQSIRHQVVRLSGFTQKLVMLSRMEEDRPRITMTDFSLSEAVNGAARPFGTVAAAKGKNLQFHIEEGLFYHGDEGAIRQVVSLLTDNAVKYSGGPGLITVRLKSAGKRKVLTVENTVDTPPADDPENWFERFYRSDESRNSATGGHGIGLATAKAIVNAHKGKISAQCIDGPVIQLVVVL